MRHKRDATPAYLIWVEHRPSNNGKGKASYVEAVQSAARREIGRPISTADIEVEIYGLLPDVSKGITIVALILSEIEEGPPGRRYRAEDLEGHRWFFFEKNHG